MSQIQPKIVFFGTPDFVLPVLQKLQDNKYEISAVVTTPDKPVGRRQLLISPAIKTAALELGLPVLQPNTLRTEDFLKQFQDLQPDLCIVASYGKIIPENYIDIPKYGWINIHPSLLPKYRGPSPVPSAILGGDNNTGITIIKMDEHMDHGPMIAQEPHTLPDDIYFPDAIRILWEHGTELLIKILPEYLTGVTKLVPQDESQATYTKKFSREDGRIDWNRSAQEIYNQIRALNPEPSTWTTWNGKNLKILKAKSMSGSLEPGKISADNTLRVGTGSGILEIEELQLESSKPLTTEQFLAGHQDIGKSKLE